MAKKKKEDINLNEQFEEISAKDLYDSSLGNYGAYINMNRAIPDYVDGMKPVWRMILYAMQQLRLTPNGKNLKSARIEGDVMGKYHPHGWCYGTIVGLAQDFTMRYPLVTGQGNFGSISGDGAAASRYTEVRPSKLFPLLVDDLNKMPDDYFIDNYDGNFKIPKYLPAKIPFVLLNGTTGIGFGLQASMIPFNMKEVIRTLIMRIKNPEYDITKSLLGPDFPLGWQVLFKEEDWKEFLYSGQGKVTFMSDIEIKENRGGSFTLIITNLPPNTTSTKVLEKIGQAYDAKKISEIQTVTDQTADNMKLDIHVRLKNGSNPQAVKKKLYKYCGLKTSISSRYIVLQKGAQPSMKSISDIVNDFIEFRKEIVRYTLQYDLGVLQKNHDTLFAKIYAVDNMKKVMDIIYNAQDDEDYYKQMKDKLGIEEKYASIISELKLKNVRKINKDSLQEEITSIEGQMKVINNKLSNDEALIEHITDEWKEISKKYSDERRTVINESSIESATITEEDLYQNFPIKLFLTQKGYIKKEDNPEIVVQNRGGKGKKLNTHLIEGDSIKKVVNAKNKDTLGLVTESGKIYFIKGYKAPVNKLGMPLSAIIDKPIDEKVVDIFETQSVITSKEVLVLYTNGKGMIISGENFDCSNGKRLFKNEVAAIEPLDETKKFIMIGKQGGRVNRIPLEDITRLQKIGQGVKLIHLETNDIVVSCESVTGEEQVLIISEGGYGKITSVDQFRVTKRGSKGVSVGIQDNDTLVFLSTLKEHQLINIITKTNNVYLEQDKISETKGRTSKGSRLINTTNSKIINVSLLDTKAEE